MTAGAGCGGEGTRRRGLGRAKTIFERACSYASKLNFLLLLFIAVTQAGWLVYLVPVGVVGLAAVMYYDIKFIYPAELEYAFAAKNESWCEMVGRLERVEEKLDKLLHRVEEGVGKPA